MSTNRPNLPDPDPDARAGMDAEVWSTLSDELRAPLTTLVGLSESLMEGDDVDRWRLERVRVHAAELLGLLQTREEAAGCEERRLLTSPRATVELCAEDHRAWAESRGLRFWTDTRPSVPAVARFDPDAVRRVLRPLLEASIRLTRSGYVGVRTSAVSPSSLLVEVMDTSEGMSQAEFERLSRPPGPLGALAPDAGFGLAVARATARRLGGDVEYGRRTPCGALLRFRLPIQRVAQPGVPAAVRGRALVAHGDVEARRHLRHLLEPTGLEVKCAETGRVAVDLALYEPFDLVFVSVDTPVLDGDVVAHALRAGHYAGRMVAISGRYSPELRDRTARAGFDACIVEPIDRRCVLQTLVRQLPQRMVPSA